MDEFEEKKNVQLETQAVCAKGHEPNYHLANQMNCKGKSKQWETQPWLGQTKKQQNETEKVAIIFCLLSNSNPSCKVRFSTLACFTADKHVPIFLLQTYRARHKKMSPSRMGIAGRKKQRNKPAEGAGERKRDVLRCQPHNETPFSPQEGNWSDVLE